jgi:hypothetical protein
MDLEEQVGIILELKRINMGKRESYFDLGMEN